MPSYLPNKLLKITQKQDEEKFVNYILQFDFLHVYINLDNT